MCIRDRGIYFIQKNDVNQSNVQIVGLGTDRRNPDVPALAVMDEILGGGFASRLMQKIRKMCIRDRHHAVGTPEVCDLGVAGNGGNRLQFFRCRLEAFPAVLPVPGRLPGSQ